MLRITDKNEAFIPILLYGDAVKIAFDYEPLYEYDEDGKQIQTDVGTWSEHVFRSRPSVGQIRDFILLEINKRTDQKILSGFVWNGMQVWLSTENQFNYKAAYDLAVQTGGANLPIVFKFGSNDEPKYHKFDTVEELTDFYVKAMTYINEQLAIGWAKKDCINWDLYKYNYGTIR